MSRFFSQGGDSSESSSSEDESSEEEELEEEVVAAPAAGAAPGGKAGAFAKGASAFMKGDDDADSDDDSKRVVRSHKDKKWDQMMAEISNMKNHIKINDWVAIGDDFDKLNKQLAKAHTIVAKEGVPSFYHTALIMLEDALEKALENKEAKKKMASSNAKALNGMKQKLRKTTKTYQDVLDKLRADEGKVEDEDEEDDEDTDEDEMTGPGTFMKVTSKKLAKQEAPSKAVPKKEQGPKKIADYNEADIDKKLDELLAVRGRKGTKKKEQISILNQLADVTKRPSKLVELFGHVIAFSFDIHMSMLLPMPVAVWQEIFNTFRRILQTLVDNPELKIEQVEGTTVFDTTQMTTAEIDEDDEEVFYDAGVTQMTGSILSYLERLDDEFYKSLQLADPHSAEYVARLKDEVPLVNLMQDTLCYYDGKGAQADCSRVSSRIVEHIYYREQSLFETAMQNAIKRKQQLLDVLEVADKASTEAEVVAVAAEEKAAEEEEAAAEGEGEENDEDDEPKVMPDLPERVAAKEFAKQAANAREAFENFMVPRAMKLGEEMSRLSRDIYQHGSERAKTRTLLCHVYHLALHGSFFSARDMLLMSHLADSINNADVSTQILYNRALVRLGICAFTLQLVPEAHSCLMELAAGARLKELLAQAVSSSRFTDRNPEQERQERRRLVPYHMHINLELVEAVHLVCAMLLELPNLAHNAFDPKRRSAAVSKTFRRLLDHFERQVFNGPPENTRDFVMFAAQLLLDGKWEAAAKHFESMTAWDLLPDPTGTRAFIATQMRSEGLRAYLISSHAHYDSISLKELAERFSLPLERTHAIVSKMMLDSEMHACWDQPTSTVVVQRMEPSKLQFLALQFADKCAQLVEANERVLDSRTGSYGYKEQYQGGGERQRRPWVERSDRYERSGHGGNGYHGRPWYNRDDNYRGGGYGGDRGGGSGRGWGGVGGGGDGGGKGGGYGNRGGRGGGDRQRVQGYMGRRF